MWDVVVVGLGAMGSATVLAAARAGARVVGVDRHVPPHDRGSTHGDTRITRLALGEGAELVPLAVRSHELWRRLEAETGERVLHEVGGVVLADPGAGGQHGADDFLATTLEAARAHGLAHEVLDAAGLAARLPPFRLRGDERGMWEPTAGFVRPEAAVAAQLARARELGADVRTGCRAVAVGEGRVALDDGEVLRARRVVLSAGAWLGALRPELAPAFPVTQQTLHWLALAPGAWEAHRDLPVFIWLTGTGAEALLYGFPALDGPDGGLKLATEQFGATVDPDGPRPAPADPAALWASLVHDRLPGLRPEAVRRATCLYTTTADSRFAIDAHPADPSLLIVSPCSGHGFKHSAAIGEAVAQLALHDRSDADLAPFGLGRLL